MRPMLAASGAGPGRRRRQKSGLPALVDTKLDGIRVQVHRDGRRIRVYTRSLDDITDRVPEIVARWSALPAHRLVLDGEVLAWAPTAGRWRSS